MAKLVRTLGENVPTELVFPVSGSRQRRASIPTVPISILELRRGLLPSRDDSAYIDEPFSCPYTIPEHLSSSDSIRVYTRRMGVGLAYFLFREASPILDPINNGTR
jgi:hypothetical protein